MRSIKTGGLQFFEDRVIDELSGAGLNGLGFTLTCLLNGNFQFRIRSIRPKTVIVSAKVFLQNLSILNAHVLAHHFEALLLVRLSIANTLDQAFHDIDHDRPVSLNERFSRDHHRASLGNLQTRCIDQKRKSLLSRH